MMETVILMVQILTHEGYIHRTQVFNQGYLSYSACLEARDHLAKIWAHEQIIHLQCYIQ